MTDDPSAPLVELPAPVDRRARLGPFPSARAALRFVSFAAVGAVLATQFGPIAWLPVVGGGFLLTAGRGDAKPLDERLSDLVRWELRRRAGPRVRRRPARIPPSARVVRLTGGRLLAVVRAGGVPVAYLPPADARALFAAYRDLLRSVPRGLVFRAGSEPLRSAPFALPPTDETSGADGAARAGYDTMVRLLCRQRRRRTVDVALWSEGAGLGRTSLDDEVGQLVARLGALGVGAERLTGDALARAVLRFGWSVEATA